MTLKKRKAAPEKSSYLENGGVDSESHTQTDLRGDKLNIAVLLVLYTLQGIPLGLAGAIPILLQSRGISYSQQAILSFVSWPFSLKLLWAPIVDALYFPKFGRRKTWLIPTQYAIGIVMLILAYNVTNWLGSTHVEPSLILITASFFMLNFLAATQDIAVDGWALTMLKRCNVGHASTCNSVGQTAGFFLGYVVFVALESASFCNTYLRVIPEKEGIVTLESFLTFWGWVFMASTTLVALFKHETPDNTDLSLSRHRGLDDIYKAYKQLYTIIKLPTVKTLALVLLTCKIGFSACDAVSSLKLVEAGVPKEDLALLAIPLVPVQIIMPLILSKHTTGSRPMYLWLKAYPLRLALAPVVAGFVALTPSLLGKNGPSFWYLSALVVIYMFHQACLYGMFVSAMAFFARISDPSVGGTYMTLLNTLSNLGTTWPSTFALWAVDHLTLRNCSAAHLEDNTCTTAVDKQLCVEGGGTCVTHVDGYYIKIVITIVIGFLWLQWGRKTVDRLQKLPVATWHIVTPRGAPVR